MDEVSIAILYKATSITQTSKLPLDSELSACPFDKKNEKKNKIIE